MIGIDLFWRKVLALILSASVIIVAISYADVNVEDEYGQAKYLVNTEKYTEALAVLKRAPETPRTSFLIGMLYAAGSGVDEDLGEALLWFRRSNALSGRFGEAEFDMAWNYINGALGHRPDYDRAAYWFELSASSGHGRAKEMVEAINYWKTSGTDSGVRDNRVRSEIPVEDPRYQVLPLAGAEATLGQEVRIDD